MTTSPWPCVLHDGHLQNHFTVSCTDQSGSPFTVQEFTCDEDAHNFADLWNHAYPPPDYPLFFVDPHLCDYEE